MALKTDITSNFLGPLWTFTLYADPAARSIDLNGLIMPDEAFSEIATDRLVLRRFRIEDAQDLSAYRSEPDVARYQSWETPFSLAQARNFIEEMLGSDPDTEGSWFQFASVLRDTGQVIGDVAMLVLDGDPGSVEIGYALAPAHAGRGHASEAVAAIVDYAITQRGKHEVMAWTDTRNTRSIALLERLGFFRDTTSRQRTLFKGAWCNEDRYIMMAADWAARG